MFEIRRQEHEVESEVHLERTVGSLLFQRSKVTTLLTLVFFFFLNTVVSSLTACISFSNSLLLKSH